MQSGIPAMVRSGRDTEDRHKISFFNDRDLKLGHFDVFNMLFPFLTFVKSLIFIFLPLPQLSKKSL